MGIHPKDHGRDNPRFQCVVCARWMRMMKTDKTAGEPTQVFFGGCSYADGGEHLATKNGDDCVCQPCCEIECKRIYESKRHD